MPKHEILTCRISACVLQIRLPASYKLNTSRDPYVKICGRRHIQSSLLFLSWCIKAWPKSIFAAEVTFEVTFDLLDMKGQKHVFHDHRDIAGSPTCYLLLASFERLP